MRRRLVKKKIRAVMATVLKTTDHGRRAMLTLAAALMLTVAFFVVAAVLPRDTVFAVEAYSEYVEVKLDESLENRWLIDGFMVCAGALDDLFSDWLPEKNDDISGESRCAPLNEIALPGPETIIVLAGGTRIIAERSAQGPLRITLSWASSSLPDDDPEAKPSVGELMQTATGVRQALPDYVVLHPAVEDESLAGRTFTFVGQAEIGRFARLGTEGLLLSGEVSAFEKGKLGSPRHLVERAKLDAGDMVRFVRPRNLNEGNGRERRSGARGFFRHAETSQDGLRVIYQGVADEVSVDRFGTLGYPLRVSWTSRVMADPMGLAVGVLLTTLALFVSVLSAIVPSGSGGRGTDNDTGKTDSSIQKTGPEGTSGTDGGQGRPAEESTPNKETSIPSSSRSLMMAALLGVSLMPAGSESRADQAHVSGGENGQAFLIQSGGACFALSPTHVIGEMGFAALVRQGTGRIHGDAMAVHHFGYDLTLLHVTGEAARLCGPQASALPRDISERLEQASHGSIRVVHPNGSADLLPVVLVGHNPTHLRVRPRETGQQIRQGMSGATVLVDNEPVGLLMAVDEEGVGQVLRFDIALRTVDVILAVSPPAPKIGAPSDSKTAPAPSIEQPRTRVIRATARSIGPDNTPDRLVAPRDEGGAWIATFDTLPVEVVLELHEGEVVATSGVTLVADDPAIDPQALPRRVEIFRTVAREGDHAWRSLGTWTFVNGEASRTFSFPPVRARRLRIVIHANWGADDQVALARISPVLAR